MSGFLDGQTVLTPEGALYTLANAWTEKPVWLTFIRHFG
jgi:hypothetical protein